MRLLTSLLLTLVLLTTAHAQKIEHDIRYLDDGHAQIGRAHV